MMFFSGWRKKKMENGLDSFRKRFPRNLRRWMNSGDFRLCEDDNKCFSMMDLRNMLKDGFLEIIHACDGQLENKFSFYTFVYDYRGVYSLKFRRINQAYTEFIYVYRYENENKKLEVWISYNTSESTVDMYEIDPAGVFGDNETIHSESKECSCCDLLQLINW